MDQSEVKQPVEILFPDNWTLPFLFSSPHSGSYYPADFINLTDLDLLALRQSEDFMVDQLFSGAPALGAPLVRATYPRAFCDPNRKAYELDPTMFSDPLPAHATTASARISAGLGTIPKVVSAGKLIHRAPLTFQQAQDRLDLGYFPYHQALKNLVNKGIQKFGRLLLIDCHSMPDRHLDAALPDFILGDRYGHACPSEHSAPISRALTSLGYAVRYNTPYAGGFITQHYSDTYKNVSVLQIEINRNLYMDQATLTPTENMPVLQDQLSQLIAQIGAMADFQKTG